MATKRLNVCYILYFTWIVNQTWKPAIHCSDRHLDYFIKTNLHFAKKKRIHVGPDSFHSADFEWFNWFSVINFIQSVSVVVSFICNQQAYYFINCTVCNLYLNYGRYTVVCWFISWPLCNFFLCKLVGFCKSSHSNQRNAAQK